MLKFLLSLMLLLSGLAPLLAQPVIVSQSTNSFVCDGSDITFNVTVSGTGPFIYQWLFNGTNVPIVPVITTLAGNGATSGNLGDGGPATNAVLVRPEGVAVDGYGNILIADGLARIRMVDTNGIISTVAGNGFFGFAGDGGAATNAQLSNSGFIELNGVVSDGLGQVFISDTGNNRIRKVDASGIINTIAGNGLTHLPTNNIPATNSSLVPQGIAVDRFGNVFIADTSKYWIRKVDTNGIITAAAGTNTSGAGFSGDGGPAILAKLSNPRGVAVDDAGNIYIADTSNNRIRKVDTNGIITTIAGKNFTFSGDGGFATNAGLSGPYRVIPDAFGNLYIADTSDNRIRKVDANGIISTIVGTNFSSFSGDGGPAASAILYTPVDLAFDAPGNLYIADSQNNRVRKVSGLFGTPNFQIKGANTNCAGNYQVIVTSPSGSVTSSVISLGVFYMATPPASSAAALGGPFSFNGIVAGDTPFTYQWFTSTGYKAIAVPVVSQGHVTSVSLIDGGFGYTSAPQVRFVGGSGAGAGGVAKIGLPYVVPSVFSVTVTNQGAGYATAPPVIQFDPPPTIDTPIPGQTNAALVFPAITQNDGTNYYFVVASNNYGSITSATVWLHVFLPPQNFTATISGTGLRLQFTGSASFPYVLLSATNLTPPIAWTPILTNYANEFSNWVHTVPNIVNGPSTFYRVIGRQ